MKSLAGPAMLLVVFGAFAIYRASVADTMPARAFLELEFAGADEAHSGSCYSFDTVLFANRIGSGATRTWESPREDAWTLTVEQVVSSYGGPTRRFQKFTFEKSGAQVRLVGVEASAGLSTDIGKNVDELLEAPNERHSTPVERCGRDGGSGYRYQRK